MERWEIKEEPKKGLSFNDITLIPADFSEVRSRKDVNPYHSVIGYERLPIISSNMTSVWSVELAQEVIRNGGIACMHRFCSVQDNVQMFIDAGSSPYIWGSIGIGKIELERAIELHRAGVKVLVLDVAHGAALHVIEQFKAIKSALPNVRVVVGNFDNSRQILEFVKRSHIIPDAFKVGIGPGASCATRLITGVGTPSVTCLQDCVSTGYPIIFDGGIRTPGDLCKAVALGAVAVFMGKNFAACEESGAPTKGISWDGFELTPSEFHYEKEKYEDCPENQPTATEKLYRGSAAQSSYVDQGKTDYYRTPEGGEFFIPVTGTVEELMQSYEGGLRSSMSYLGSFTLDQYSKNVKVLEVSESSKIESGLHGKS